MSSLALHEWHSGLEARFMEVNGEETVKDYGDVLAEHSTLREKVGVLDLRTIDEGFPIIGVIENPGSEAAHWIVIYGYGRKPDRLFLATNGIPIFKRKIVA